MRHATCDERHATRDMRRATRDMGYAMGRYAMGDMRHATCDLRRGDMGRGDMRLAFFDTRHLTYILPKVRRTKDCPKRSALP
mgnify:CR=1 FL=1